MKHPKTFPMHQCCPQEWRRTPDVTGSHELDAVIHRNNNKDLPSRLAMYCDTSDLAYGPITGYSGYHGYSGDN
jgi:hypothetical protein